MSHSGPKGESGPHGVTKETTEVLEAIITEIIAGKVMYCNSKRDNGWNEACDRAHRIVHKYSRGEGLFQK
jgi:hypothetical protein